MLNLQDLNVHSSLLIMPHFLRLLPVVSHILVTVI